MKNPILVDENFYSAPTDKGSQEKTTVQPILRKEKYPYIVPGSKKSRVWFEKRYLK